MSKVENLNLRFIDLNELKIKRMESGETFNIVAFTYTFPMLDQSIAAISEDLASAFSSSLEEEFQKAKQKNEKDNSYLFTFDIAAAFQNDDDVDSIVKIILMEFNGWLCSKENREREHRFGLPAELTDIQDNNHHIMKMVNRKTKTDKFNLSIAITNMETQDSCFYSYIR